MLSAQLALPGSLRLALRSFGVLVIILHPHTLFHERPHHGELTYVSQDVVKLAASKESAHKSLDVDLVHGVRSLQPVHTMLVVDLALFLVRQHLVGFGDAFEARLGIWVVFVLVWMPLFGRSVVPISDLLRRRVATHTKQLIKVRLTLGARRGKQLRGQLVQHRLRVSRIYCRRALLVPPCCAGLLLNRSSTVVSGSRAKSGVEVESSVLFGLRLASTLFLAATQPQHTAVARARALKASLMRVCTRPAKRAGFHSRPSQQQHNSCEPGRGRVSTCKSG